MEGYSTITVRELRDLCDAEIKNGFGDRQILITSDDEGNSYHGLIYGFSTDPEEIAWIENYGCFDLEIDPRSVVLLG